VPSHRTPTQHLKSRKCRLPPLLGGRTAQENLVDDDPGSDLRHRGDSLDPRRLQRAEFLADAHFAVRGDLDPGRRGLHGRRHRLGQRVGPESQPGIRQHGLQAPGDPGFSELDPPLRMIT
jgi:hypothetical protein